jgi:DNA-binding response OmpR family regulator
MASKILIVEDEQGLLNTLADEFSSTGFTVLKSSNGVEGLRTALHEHPDAILLDIMMPQMDGLTMMQKLRADAWGASAKVILLTNLDPDGDVIQKVNEYKPTYYFVKSNIKIEELLTKIKEVVGIAA